MGESRGQMEARLRREGRWDAFRARRKELKAGGMTGSEADAQAIEEFSQPLPRTDGDADRVPAEVFQGKSMPTQEIIGWVVDNIAISNVKPEDAPSPGAWAMLRWVQRTEANESVFWRLIFPKLSGPSKTDERDGSSGAKEIVDNTAELDALIGECLGENDEDECLGENQAESVLAGQETVGLGV